MYEREKILSFFGGIFNRYYRPAFRRFLKRLPEQKDWFLASDYNWNEKGFPNDAIIFSLYPIDKKFRGLEAINMVGRDLKKIFVNDLKKTRSISDKIKGWFWRRNAAFHFCFVLDKKSSLWLTPGEDSLEIVRMDIKRTNEYFKAKVNCDFFDEIRRRIEQESKSNNFNCKLYSDFILLIHLYVFIVVILDREDRLSSLQWCSDKDALFEWCEGDIIDWVGMYRAKIFSDLDVEIQEENLPIYVPEKCDKELLDPAIRPPDFLAGPLANWNIDRNLPERTSKKYADVIDNIIYNNPNICIFRLSMKKSDGTIGSMSFEENKLSLAN